MPSFIRTRYKLMNIWDPKLAAFFLQRNRLGSACPDQHLFGKKKNGWGLIFSRLDYTPVTSPVYVPPWEVTSGKARGLLNSGKFEPTYVRNSYETFTTYDMINQAVVHFKSIYKLRDFSVSWMVSYGMSQYLKWVFLFTTFFSNCTRKS